MEVALIERLMTPGESWAAFFERPSWHDQAACRGVDTEQFFPDVGDVPATARLVCGRCPVAAECLSYALSDPALSGVWAGTSARQRKRLRQSALSTPQSLSA